MPQRLETYGDYWDHYAATATARTEAARGDGDITWPGDEWGSPERWRSLFAQLFKKHLPTETRSAIEIGPGSGKYTLMFLEAFPRSTVIAADVSSSYLDVLKRRCAGAVTDGRIYPTLIENRHTALEEIAHNRAIRDGSLDVLFSIDAMVHVDLQYLFAYWLSAQKLLRPGGKIIMTVADATREMGFAKLVKDTPRLFPFQGRPTDKFEWLCPELVHSVLGRLGFTVQDALPTSQRDFCFVATRLDDRQ